MKIILLAAVICFVSNLGGVCHAEEPTDQQMAQLLYRGVSELKYFYYVGVTLDETAKAAGLNEADLGYLAKMSVLRNFPGFELKKLPPEDQRKDLKKQEWGIITITVTAHRTKIGSAEVFALHSAIEISRMADKNGSFSRDFLTQAIGLGQLADFQKRSIDILIEAGAKWTFLAQGKL